MDFSYQPEDIEFRMRLRKWLQENLPAGWGTTVFEPKDEEARARFRLDWERQLYKGGWLGINIPRKFGGLQGTPIQRAIYAEEMARARAPEGLNIIGRNLVSSTLIHHGTSVQCERYLPKILSGEEVWCQGFSEPNAGSDLASLRCRAERDGDHFVVNGQKVWTSYAQYSQWCILLARTDPSVPKHRGISLFLVDMRSPGVSLRPLKQLSGESEFNETFFENVRVPVTNLVGEINDGWKIAMTTLGAERGADDALGRQIRFKQELDQLLAAATRISRDGAHAIDDPVLRQKLAKSVIEIEVMRLSCLRSFSKSLKGGPPGAEASMLKLYWSNAAQAMFETALETLGPLAPFTGEDPLSPESGRFQLSFLHSRAFTIYSGSSEIQRTIIGERLLGLPK